jgi:hypothetical protein
LGLDGATAQLDDLTIIGKVVDSQSGRRSTPPDGR